MASRKRSQSSQVSVDKAASILTNVVEHPLISVSALIAALFGVFMIIGFIGQAANRMPIVTTDTFKQTIEGVKAENKQVVEQIQKDNKAAVEGVQANLKTDHDQLAQQIEDGQKLIVTKLDDNSKTTDTEIKDLKDTQKDLNKAVQDLRSDVQEMKGNQQRGSDETNSRRHSQIQ